MQLSRFLSLERRSPRKAMSYLYPSLVIEDDSRNPLPKVWDHIPSATLTLYLEKNSVTQRTFNFHLMGNPPQNWSIPIDEQDLKLEQFELKDGGLIQLTLKSVVKDFDGKNFEWSIAVNGHIIKKE